jgi:pSer/pThr/pTyr-binding forkhead associated (FHA) protein
MAAVAAAPVFDAAPVFEAAPVEVAALEAAPVFEAAPVAPAPVAAAPAAAGAKLAPDAKPRLVVLRGLKINVEYPIYEGNNFIGRADEKPVDIDLDDQEPPDRVWSSRQHALIVFENSELVLEDLNSANGTFVNRTRVYPGQKRSLAPNDVVQIGTVQLKLKV